MTETLNDYFDNDGLSKNGEVQLNMEDAYHNCACGEGLAAYEQTTTIPVIDEIDAPLQISDDENANSEIIFTVLWAITNPDAEEAEDTCDWSDYEITCDAQGFDLKKLLTK